MCQVYARADQPLTDFEVRVGDSTKWQGGNKCKDTKFTLPKGQNMKIDCTGQQGRYVFIVIPNGQRSLSMCEVRVFGSDPFGSNAAFQGSAEQSSTENGADASRAVDGKTSTIFSQKSCTMTKKQNDPWWSVDLKEASTVSTVQLWNRGDCCGERLSDAEVRVGMSKSDWTQNHICGAKFSVPQGSMKSIACGMQRGRYVHVVLRKNDAILTLCEVRVQTVDPKKGISIARGKPAKQSSTQGEAVASRAVDGNIDTDFASGSCTATHYDNEPWWRVDLETKREIGGVQIWNRGDCCGSRLSNFEVRVGMHQEWSENKQCGLRHSVPQGRRSTIACNGIEGRYVYIVKRARSYLNICEVRIIPFDALKGDDASCTSHALGVEDRNKISATMITASSVASTQNSADNARLNYRGDSWTSLYKKTGEWLQIALPKPTTITAIGTQGSEKAAQWVTKYKVKYQVGSKGVWKDYDESRVLDGSSDQSREQKTVLKKPFDATAVRIFPEAWSGAISMRVELYGHTCKADKRPKHQEHSEHEQPRCENEADVMKCVPARQTELVIKSFPGYGTGEAKLWYAQDKGDERSTIMGRSMYVDDAVDFRTQKGSIYSSKDLVAARYVRIGAWPGYGSGAAQLRFSHGKESSEDEEASNSLYLDNANFHVREGNIVSDQNIRAGKYLEIQAKTGYGEGVAQLWYSEVLKGDYKAETLYLKKGNFATETGDIIAAKDITAGEFLEINAFPKFGQGTAQFWYAGDGKDGFQSKSVYLKTGDFRTQHGDIYAKKDLHAGRYLVLESQAEFGLGAAKLWYAKDTKNGLGPNTVYLDEADFSVEDGSISSTKDISCGRFLTINAYPGYGSGEAKLWYSQVGDNNYAPDSLYLKKGDIRTETGSIHAAKDIRANRFIAISALSGHGEGEAKLWYSASAKGEYAAQSLYLKQGDLRTEDGSVIAGKDVVAQRFLAIEAMSGYGTGQAQLWYSNAQKDGKEFNSLYLKSGDFRTEKGSIVAAKDIVATESLKFMAHPGYGTGETKLWYSQDGEGDYNSKSLYLSTGDFRTEHGSIYAAKEVHAGRYLEVSAWPGHGSGSAQLWHGRKNSHSSTITSTLYLKEGSFMTQKGSIIAQGDISAGRYLMIGASQGFGSGSAKLWYSGTGRGSFSSTTLFLEKGDFETLNGGIRASADIVAGRNIKGEKLEVKFAQVTGGISAGHLFLGKTPHGHEASMEDATELLDITQTETRVDVGAVMHQLDTQLKTLSDKNGEMRTHLDALLGRISDLEKR